MRVEEQKTFSSRITVNGNFVAALQFEYSAANSIKELKQSCNLKEYNFILMLTIHVFYHTSLTAKALLFVLYVNTFHSLTININSV